MCSSCLELSREGDEARWEWIVWAEFCRRETPTCLSAYERDPVEKGTMQTQGRAA